MSDCAGRMLESATEGLVRRDSSRRKGPKLTRVFIDVDTQRDFMYPHGAAYFRQAAQIAQGVAKLFSCARSRAYPVISTTMCIRNNGQGPHHSKSCLEGTNGQKKPAFTLLAKRKNFSPCGDTDLPTGLLRGCQQVIFAKRGADPFEQPRFDRLLTETKAEEYVVFGLATEEAVKYTVLGLLARGKQVKLVIDATAGRDEKNAQMAIRQMIAKGARITTARELSPNMQPRPNLDALLERWGVATESTAGQLASRMSLDHARAGGNGNGNGKKAKARLGGNGNGKGNGHKGNGNGKKLKSHAGNGNGHKGNGNGKSKHLVQSASAATEVHAD